MTRENILGPKLDTAAMVRDHRTGERSRELLVPRQAHVQGCKKSIIARTVDRVNWNAAINDICIGLAVVAILTIFGVILFGPTSMREFWR